MDVWSLIGLSCTDFNLSLDLGQVVLPIVCHALWASWVACSACPAIEPNLSLQRAQQLDFVRSQGALQRPPCRFFLCTQDTHLYNLICGYTQFFISCYLIQFQTCVDSDFRYIKYCSVFCPTLEQKRGRWFWWTHPGREITLWPFGRCQKPSSWNMFLVAPGNEEASRKLNQFGTASSTENAPMQFHSPIFFLLIDKKEYWIDSRTYHTVL